MSGFDLRRDPLAEEQAREEVELPIDEDRPEAGVYHVTLQDLPDKATHKKLSFLLSSAQACLGEVAGVRQELELSDPSQVQKRLKEILAKGKRTAELADAYLEAQASVEAAQRAIVRVGVCGHSAEDFRVKGKPTPFVSDPLLGPHGSGCGEPTLRLYETLGILGELAAAVLQFQDGSLLEAKEAWAKAERARKKREEEKAKKKEEAKISPSQSTQETLPAPNGSV